MAKVSICNHVACYMSNAYVDPWDMLSNFCFNFYSQKSLFIRENGNVSFDITFLPSEWTNHIAGSQLKMLHFMKMSSSFVG